ncbi:MAG: response regulator [Saprospiraceae bacterium]|nr:response regulator [Pyrinomonadaceae bacterium]
MKPSPQISLNKISPRRILVADDDPSILRLVTAVLENEGFAVIAASDGKAAYKILQSGTPIHAVVLDVNMPYIGGHEIVKFMQSNDRFKAIPIIIMTGEQDPRSSSNNIKAGAVAFLPKPFTNSQLKMIVEVFAARVPVS